MSHDLSPKDRAAVAAAELVEDGMIVGLGSGTTASRMIRRLGERVEQQGLRLSGVATSVATAVLARSVGIAMVDLDHVGSLDLCLDGADEVDPAFRLIKGRGGALLREKLVATAARRRVTVITADKRVAQLGQRMPIPVEVSPFGLRHVEASIRRLGAETSVRIDEEGKLFETDGGHRILDCRFAAIEDPDTLECQLRGIVGVFETGLFLGLCDQLVVGGTDGVEIVDRPTG